MNSVEAFKAADDVAKFLRLLEGLSALQPILKDHATFLQATNEAKRVFDLAQKDLAQVNESIARAKQDEIAAREKADVARVESDIVAVRIIDAANEKAKQIAVASEKEMAESRAAFTAEREAADAEVATLKADIVKLTAELAALQKKKKTDAEKVAAAKTIEELNSEIADLSARRDAIKDDLSKIAAKIA